MRKKLQIFISSTYTDLKPERQAAVEAILIAGHIPAGMELFSAGNESQLETVKRWIDESDIYLLILGGRYGTIEPSSQKSYTQVEYEYALHRGMPVFAVVINDDALEQKVKIHGQGVLELVNREKYMDFKSLALSKISKFFDEPKDIKLAIHETLADFLKRFQFSGWISGKEVPDIKLALEENIKMRKENDELKRKIKESVQVNKKNLTDELSFEEVEKALKAVKLEYKGKKGESKIESAHFFFVISQNSFATGIDNRAGMSDTKNFLFYNVAPTLMKYDLVTASKVAGVQWQTIKTTKTGYKYLRRVAEEVAQEKK